MSVGLAKGFLPHLLFGLNERGRIKKKKVICRANHLGFTRLLYVPQNNNSREKALERSPNFRE